LQHDELRLSVIEQPRLPAPTRRLLRRNVVLRVRERDIRCRNLHH
jgi:hypothetical protein